MIKRLIVEGNINIFLEECVKKYHFYLKNISKHMELSKRTIEFCRSFDFNFDINYKKEFKTKETVKLSYEIISSINPRLGKYFIEKLKDKTIEFRNDAPYSYTTDEEGSIKIIIKKNNNISDSLALIHEFFHIVHLVKSKSKFKEENYYCYTETLGMMSEYYSILYLLNNRPDLKDDLSMYLNESLLTMYIKAESTLRDGCLIDIYDNYGNLSKKSIASYVEANKLSKDYLTILKYKYNTKITYGDSIRYISSLPAALSLAYQLYYDKDFKDNIMNILNELGKISYIDWMKKYTSIHISNEENMIENAKVLRQWLYDTFYSNEKVKKIGEI